MGYLGGFLGALGDKAQKKLEEHSAQDTKQKAEQAQVYWDAIKSGRLSPEQIKYAQDQLQKLYPKSKGIKDVFSKIGQLTGMVHGKGGESGQQQQGGSAPITPPPGAKANPQETPIATAQKTSVAPPPSFSTMTAAAYPNPDEQKKKERDEAFSTWQQQQEIMHKYKMEEQAEAAKAKAANPTGRATGLSPISMTAARKMAEHGMVFNGAGDGQPLTLDDYDDTMMLVPLQQNGHIVGYSPASQHQTHMTFNNQVIAVPALNQMDANTMGVVQGVAKTGTTNSRETVAVDADGNPIKQTLTSTSTPNTPATGSKTSVTPPPGVKSTTQPKVQERPTLKMRNKPPAAATTGSTGSMAGAPKPAYMTPAMYKQGIERVTPIREAATQVLGDPTQPEMKSLKDYAYVAEDKEARERVGKAVRLTFDGLEEKNSHDPGFLHLIPGQLVQWGEMKIGLPQILAGAKAEQLQGVISDLKPDERKLYNKIMSAYGAIIGLRSLTKAGSSNFSMQKIEQEAPLPGLNAVSAAQMYDQLANLAEIIYNGTRTLPDTIMPKDEKEYFKSQVSELLALSNGKKPSSGVTPPPGAKSTPKTADDYLNGLKGKKVK